MLGFAAAAAIAIKVPVLFGLDFTADGSFYARNLSLFVLPFLAMYFIWKRGLSTKGIVGLAAVFAAGAVFANVYPFTPDGIHRSAHRDPPAHRAVARGRCRVCLRRLAG